MKYSTYLRRQIFVVLVLFNLAITHRAMAIISQGESGKVSPSTKVSMLLKRSWKLRNTNPEESKRLALEALDLSKKHDYDSGLMKAYSFAGVAYRNTGNLEKALKHYALSFDLAYKLKNNEEMAYAYLNLGNLQLYLGEPEEARGYLKKVEPLLEKVKNKSIDSYYKLYMGRVMLMEERFDEAINSLEASLIFRKNTNNKNGEATCLKYIGDAYLGKEQYQKALSYYEKASAVFGSGANLYFSSSLKVNQARAYVYQRELVLAKRIAVESLELARKIPSMFIMKQALIVLSEVFQANHEFEVSAEYLRNALAYQDSINTKKLQDRLERFEFSMDKLQFEHEQEMAKLRQSKNLMIYMILLTVSTLITIIVLRANYLIKKSNKRLIVKNDEIIQLSEVKKDLVSMIVHDLKNPVNAIMSLTDMDKNSPYSPYINQSSKEMLKLIANMLEVSRMEEENISLSVTPVYLHEKVAFVIEQLSFLMQQRDIRISNKVDASIFARADGQYVGRVFCNLVSNAIKFSDNDSEIVIWSEHCRNQEGFIKILVKDSGDGIPMDLQCKIFDKFWKSGTCKIGASSGLGLTFCKMAVEAHGGQIGVTSIPGEGSTFWFTLPVYKNHKKKAIKHVEEDLYYEFVPTQEEMKIIQEAIKALSRCNVGETGRITMIIHDISYDKRKHPFIENWVTGLEKAYETGDDALFKQALSLAG